MVAAIETLSLSSQHLFFVVPLLLFALLIFIRTVPPQWRPTSKFSAKFPSQGRPEKNKDVGEEYYNVFPPSQRENLPLVDPKLPNKQLICDPNRLLKLEEDYRHADDGRHLFSGFTVGEIKALGDFPDYATISGVPLPAPLLSFNIDTAAPRPYRPFRWAYHQTMSLKKMDSDYWLELESTYKDRVKQRQDLHAQYGEGVMQQLPGSELACKELAEMVVQFLCARYPRQFELVDGIFVNHILGTREVISVENSLRFILNNLPEDFGIMLRDPATGQYVFRAGVICSSVGWCLGDKIGHGLPQIHKTVPDYKEKMQFSMDRFFTKMPTFKPIQRGSWGLEIGQPLFLPSAHPHLELRNHQDPNLSPSDISLRVDWQTLRRLPLSGAIIFNFKALFTPMTTFKDEPYIPSLVLKVLNEGKENIMKYKGTWHVEHVVKPALAEYAKHQVREGLIPENWEPQTLDENPFFPGWEQKWAKQSQK